MDEVRIEVTQTHMKRALRSSPSSCAIALAVKGQFDSPVHVNRTFLTIHGKRFRHTSSLYRWIKRFDAGFIVPFITIVFKRGCVVGICSDRNRRFNSTFKYETNEELGFVPDPYEE